MIFTSLLLLLCQSEPSIIGPVTFTPAQPQESTQNPDLVLDTATWADYRMAMHLIDVRGRYDEGAAKLLQLVDQPDVILFSGQASWMLAQAARALTLAGKNEEAAKYIPGARNGSRSTPMEGAVDELLSSFAPQSAGLNPEFLEYVATNLRSHGGGTLQHSFGRELLPYLRFIFENSQGDFSLFLRKQSADLLFGLADEETGVWLGSELLEGDFVSRKSLLNSLDWDGDSLGYFMDLKAKEATSAALVSFARSAPEGSKDLALDSLVYLIGTPIKSNSSKDLVPVSSRVSAQIVALVEEGFVGEHGLAIRNVAGLSGNMGGLPSPVFVLAESKNERVREAARWALMSTSSGVARLREYALGGEIADQLRFCLLTSPMIMAIKRTNREEGIVPYRTWISKFLKAGEVGAPYSPYWDHRQQSFEDVAALASCVSSNHPLVRLLAADSLLALQETERASQFLKGIGTDPTWAKLFLQHWEYARPFPIPASESDFFMSLGEEGPLVEEVRALFEGRGHEALTLPLMVRWNLNASGGVKKAVLKRATSSEVVPQLVQLMVDQDTPVEELAWVAEYLGENMPRAYIENIPHLEKASRRWDFLAAESYAWMKALNSLGPAFLGIHEQYLGSFLFHPKTRNDLGRIFDYVEAAPDLVIRQATLRADDRQTMQWFFGKSNAWIRLSNAEDSEASTRFASELVIHNMATIRNVSSVIRGTLVNPNAEAAVPLFDYLWSKELHSKEWSDYLIPNTMKVPALRERFHEQLLSKLQDPGYSGAVAAGCLKQGVVADFLEGMLQAIERERSPRSLAILLTAIGTVEDPRVIEALVLHLTDPREGVSASASKSLDRLRKLKQQREEWSMWVEGGEPLSPYEALLKNLRDPDLEIRLVSIESLGTLGEKDALPALINLLRDEDPQIKTAARKALDRINKVPTSTQSQVKAQLTVHLVELEGELAALRLKFTDSHMDVAAVLKKIEVAKEQLAELKSD